MFTHTRRDAQFFQTARNRLKILCAKSVTWRNLHIDSPQISGVSVQNLCTPVLTLATLSSSDKYWLEDKTPWQLLPSSFLPNSVWTNHTSQAGTPIRIWTPDYPVCNPSCLLTLNLLTTTIVALPSNASKWQIGFNSAFKGLRHFPPFQRRACLVN